MMPVVSGYAIVALRNDELEAFYAYVADHLRDSGSDGTPVFMPMARDGPFDPQEKATKYRLGTMVAVGGPKWRRGWAARTPEGSYAGHVDLRARSEPHSEHRALLGMGVHRDHRRRGLGRQLIEHVVAWAQERSELVWIDLDVIGENIPAQRLYESMGFRHTCLVEDMFRFDGRSFDHVSMTRRIR